MSHNRWIQIFSIYLLFFPELLPSDVWWLWWQIHPHFRAWTHGREHSHTQVISMPITVMRCLTMPLFEWQGPMGPRGPPGAPGSSVRTNLIPSYFTVFLSCSWVEEWSTSGPHRQTTIKCLFQNKIYKVGHHSWKKCLTLTAHFVTFWRNVWEI